MKITPRDRSGDQSFTPVEISKQEARDILARGGLGYTNKSWEWLYPAVPLEQGFGAQGWMELTYTHADLLRVANS